MTRLLGISVLLLVLASGCSGSAPPEPPDDPPSATTTGVPQSDDGTTALAPELAEAVQPAWTTKLDVVGQPVVAGPVAVVIARAKDRLEVVALDLDDGGVRWRRRTSPGDLSTYYDFDPLVARTSSGEHRVLVRSPVRHLLNGSSYTALKVVDPATGYVVRETGNLSSSAPLDECDNGQDVCGVGWAGRAYQPFRWDLDTGKVTVLPGVEAAREVGDDLFATDERPGEELVMLRHGKPVWRKRVVDMFGARATSDRGWEWDRFEDDDVVAGLVGRGFPADAMARFAAGRPVTHPIYQYQQSIGLDADSGRVLWRIPRAAPWCADAVLGPEEQWPPVLCVFDGRMREQEKKDRRYLDVGVEIRGYEPRSGRTTWSVTLTPRSARRMAKDDDVPLVPGGMAVGVADGTVALDLRDGTTRVLPDDLVLWCAGDSETIKVDGTKRDGGQLYRPCTPDGRSADGPVTQEALAAVPAVRGWTVVSVDGKVLGFRA